MIFPKIETLFEYKFKGDNIEIEEPKGLDAKNLIFGIRPCDAVSFRLLENFFGFGEFKDDLFLTKRKNTNNQNIEATNPPPFFHAYKSFYPNHNNCSIKVMKNDF